MSTYLSLTFDGLPKADIPKVLIQPEELYQRQRLVTVSKFSERIKVISISARLSVHLNKFFQEAFCLCKIGAFDSL